MSSILEGFASWPLTVRIGTALLGLIAIWFIINTVRSYLRLSHIPGPPGTGSSKWWMIRGVASGEMPFRLAAVCRKYGSLARIGPNDLVTDDAETVRLINGLRSPFTRSDWYNATAFSHDMNHAFCEKDDERHADRRNKLIPGYSGREIEGLESGMDARIEDLCALIEKKYLSDETTFRPVDLARLASYFTLEVIHTLAFGGTMGFLEHDNDMYGYLANQKQMLPLFEWLSNFPSLERLLRIPFISKGIMPKKSDPTGVGLLFKLSEDAIRERKESKRKDMLASFLAHGITEKEAEQEAVLQIIAGSDTTASAIRMISFYIMTNPRVTTKVVNEITNAEQNPGLSTPISNAEAQELPYLNACVKEGLRMWPPVVGLNSKVVPPEGAEILGKFVPGGTCIAYAAFSLQRSKELFGADADIFRPERWIDATKDEKTLAEMSIASDLIFGYGKNACLGKPIAQIEMRKAIAELIRRFDMNIVRPEKPFNSVNRNGLFICEDMLVRIEKRRQS